MLDDHGLQAVCCEPCSEPVQPTTASKQFILAEFHGGDVGHGGKYTDRLSIDTADLRRI
jgi:hypothetical protein